MLFLEAAQKRFLQVIESLLHTPYLWGGDDPTGFDCSGLVVEGLKSAGLIGLREDFSAEGLWQHFRSGNESITPGVGFLAFWFEPRGIANHVAVCLDQYHCITADGGGSRVKSIEDAIRYNAYIKIRPIKHRKTDPKFLNIFQP